MVVSKQLTLLFTNNGFETLSTRGTQNFKVHLFSYLYKLTSVSVSNMSCFRIAYVDCTVSTATAIF